MCCRAMGYTQNTSFACGRKQTELFMLTALITFSLSYLFLRFEWTTRNICWSESEKCPLSFCGDITMMKWVPHNNSTTSELTQWCIHLLLNATMWHYSSLSMREFIKRSFSHIKTIRRIWEREEERERFFFSSQSGSKCQIIYVMSGIRRTR